MVKNTKKSRLGDLIKSRASEARPINPLEVFNTLSLRKSNVAELWRPQSDALRKWHDRRDVADTLLKMNTGSGKTLVGLIMAQSIVNESKGKVLYVCATNQLLEQTKEKASEYGIETSEYYKGSWVGDAYDRAVGPALTNYQAVFNGKSIFRYEDLKGVIFDDAHTAHGIIREQYTLRINRDENETLYLNLIRLFRQYFEETNRTMVFRDVVESRRDSSVLFVPTFVAAPLGDRLSSNLTKGDVAETQSTLFAWEHLKDHLGDCALFFDRNCIEFTPPLPPVHLARPFREGVKRIYLSATLPDDDLFCRTFGRPPNEVIDPGGRAGDTERMLLFPLRAAPKTIALDWAKGNIEKRKAMIMVPHFEAAGSWKEVGETFTSAAGHDRIRSFADSKNEKLVFVARYDGIDLPGDACRIMVVDGLPVGVGLMERFFENHLETGRIADGIIASRFIQLLGRISRGMSDYGVVLLVGDRLRKWLDSPDNKQRLPHLIQLQLQLGEELSEAEDEYSTRELIDKCLERDQEWLDLYDGFINSSNSPPTEALEHEIIGPAAPLAERRFIEALWNGDPLDAAAELDKARSILFEQNRSFGAWYLHWQAHCLSRSGHSKEAVALYKEAARVSRELGQVPYEKIGEVDPEKTSISKQADRIVERLSKRAEKMIEALDEACDLLSKPAIEVDPRSGVSTGQHEESVRVIGDCLGFEATRPDKSKNTGPDVLWAGTSGTWWLFELKTGKKGTAYNKEEVGQIHDHIQWGKDEIGDTFSMICIGPRLPVTENSNPPRNVSVVDAGSLVEVGRRLLLILKEAIHQQLPLFRAPKVEQGLRENGLTEADILASMAPIDMANLE